MRTLGQKRSEFALKKVLEKKEITALKNFSAGAPSIILQNGFGQALAFWASKGKPEHNALLDIIREWFEEQKDFFIQTDTKGMLLKLSEISQQEYFAAQQEALNLLEWVKRYANAFIQD
jgi:CRISPR-associated protein Cmr5